MNTVTVRIDGRSWIGRATMPAAVKGGLAVHRAVDGFGWTVTHMQSGLAIGTVRGVLQAAQLRDGLLEIVGSWDVSEDEILATVFDPAKWTEFLVRDLIRHFDAL